MGDAGLPDYVLDPNAVMKDDSAKWRYGRAPDYTKTRKMWSESEYSGIPALQFGRSNHELL